MLKGKLRILLFSLLLFCLAAGVAGVLVYVHVYRETGDRIERGVIDSIIFSESPVYYDDGKSVMGVFFEKTHRQYIHYEEIPPYFIKALIATEDRNYFHHPGFDPKAILRALFANIRKGEIVQGGSTITQQTAKNIFKRERRSFRSKIKELVQSLLLERKYTKEEILEMYVNQFFVTGFGRGLRIAAQYFFDKEAEDLDLVESAFVAGSVKSPNRYNPFTKRSQAERTEARRLSKRRKDLVLASMLKMNFITQEQFMEAKAREVPFKEGRVTYALNVILDYIREQLESEFFRAVLEEQGVDNISTSGIKIYTSVNKEIQEGALYSIRHHLPLLDVKLTGFGGNSPKRGEGSFEEKAPKKQEGDLPFLCRITHIQDDPKNPQLVVAWDSGGGIIDYEGFEAVAAAWLKGRIGNWAAFDRSRVPDFFKQFKVGDLIAVQFKKSREEEDNKAALILSKIPELEGGIVVVRNGMIKAMVGGFFDRFFNRAVDAKRQLGSIFKPIVYAAALQLNWSPLDPLINMPDLFKFENTLYVPKPDHQPEADRVSLSWAGVKSENLATVWLLYHLTDRLNLNEFRRVMEMLDLAREHEESYEDYVVRIRDEHGVIVDTDALMEAAFEVAKSEIEPDLIFGGYEKALGNLSRIHFVRDPTMMDPEDGEDLPFESLSFSRLLSLNEEMKDRLKLLRERLDYLMGVRDPAMEAGLFSELSHFYRANDQRGPNLVVYSGSAEQVDPSQFQPMNLEAFSHLLEEGGAEDIWIEGQLPSKAIDLLQSQMRKIYLRLMNYRRYDAEVLWRIGDFRRLVNLHFVCRLAKEMGITTKLDPVLSFPLGANSVSILEAALAYQAIMTGRTYPLGESLESNMVPIITRIVDRQGKTIWEYEAHPKKVLSERTSALICDMLRLVVENGTGRAAKGAVQLSLDAEDRDVGLPVPSFGKTGTANRFTNSSFVGFIPGPVGSTHQLGLEQGYVIASYVGYDDNRPMKGKQVVVYGASGALPIWIDVGNAIANSAAYRKDLEVVDLAFNLRSTQLATGDGLHRVAVSSISGLPAEQQEEKAAPSLSRVLVDAGMEGGALNLRRVFEADAGDGHEQK